MKAARPADETAGGEGERGGWRNFAGASLRARRVLFRAATPPADLSPLSKAFCTSEARGERGLPRELRVPQGYPCEKLQAHPLCAPTTLDDAQRFVFHPRSSAEETHATRNDDALNHVAKF